jgi:superfamily II DNA or RNA helicase
VNVPTLRDYQIKAVESIEAEWEEKQSTFMVMCTGGGKTTIFCELISRRPKGRAMIVAHREELIYQAAERLALMTGSTPQIEMAYMHATGGFFGFGNVVASIQSLISGNGTKRYEKFNPDDFTTLVIDEGHHSCAVSYRLVIDHFKKNPNCKILGVSATPDRADEKSLGMIYESNAVDYDILNGINDGWLVPIKQQFVMAKDLDLSACRTTAGDLNGADLARVMEYEAVLHEVAGPTLEICGERKTLIFTASVAQAERLAEILNRHRPDCAQWVHGGTPKDVRKEMFADYSRGRFQFLVNVGITTEGWDEPLVEVIVQARPTKSRALYAQTIGRSTRPLPGLVDQYPAAEERKAAIAASAKPSALVLDFVGNSGRHKLMTTADVLGGNYDDDIIELAERNAKRTGVSVDMRECLQDAARQKHEEAERRKREEAARRQAIRANVQYSARDVNPFEVFDLQPARQREWDKGKPVSEKMRGILEKQGIDPDKLSFSEARQILGQIFHRWDKGLCSFKQAKLLKKNGLPGDVTREQAKIWIDRIAQNGWRCPPDIRSSVA